MFNCAWKNESSIYMQKNSLNYLNSSFSIGVANNFTTETEYMMSAYNTFNRNISGILYYTIYIFLSFTFTDSPIHFQFRNQYQL